MDRAEVDQLLAKETTAWSQYPSLVRELVARLLTGADANFKMAGIPVISVRESGTFGYDTGVEGLADLPAGARVLSIACQAPAAADASFTIAGGKPIAVPAGQSFAVSPEGKLSVLEVEFTGTQSFFVEYVIPSPEVDGGA